MPFVLHARTARSRPHGLLLGRELAQLPADRLQRRNLHPQLQVTVGLDRPYRLQSLPRRRVALQERLQEPDHLLLTHRQPTLDGLHAGSVPLNPPREPLLVVVAQLRPMQQSAEILDAHWLRPPDEESQLLHNVLVCTLLYLRQHLPRGNRTRTETETLRPLAAGVIAGPPPCHQRSQNHFRKYPRPAGPAGIGQGEGTGEWGSCFASIARAPAAVQGDRWRH
jgi:hypothetical protein